MKDKYFRFYTFRDMNIYEMGLMSLILSYHKSNKVICFSNEYAALRLGLSKNTISRTISSLRQKGFIETDITPIKRFIRVILEPETITLGQDTCDLSDQTPPLTGDTSNLIGEGVSPNRVGGLTSQVIPSHLIGEHIIKRDIKEDNKEDVVVAKQETPTTDFDLLVKSYGEKNRINESFNLWINLSDVEKKEALDRVDACKIYTQQNQVQYDLWYYLNKKVFQWGSLFAIQKEINKQKKVKPVLTNQEKLRRFEQEFNLTQQK